MAKDVLRLGAEQSAGRLSDNLPNVPFQPSRELDDSWNDPVEWRSPVINLLLTTIGIRLGRRFIGRVQRLLNDFDDTPRFY